MKMKPQKILINYATKSHVKTQKKNTESGMSVGNFDRVIEYSPLDLDEDFRQRNHDLLSRAKLAGFGVWKPYVILKTLNREDIADGDFIFYSDSDVAFLTSIDQTVEYTKKSGQFLWATIWGNEKCRKWAKRDMFILTDCDSEKYYNANSVSTTFFGIIKCKESIDFFREFLRYAEDPRILTDDKNELGENLPEFRGYLHDQSLFSLLTMKHGVKTRPTGTPDNPLPVRHLSHSDYRGVRNNFHIITILVDTRYHSLLMNVRKKRGSIAYYFVYGFLYGAYTIRSVVYKYPALRENSRSILKKSFLKRFFV